MSGAATTLESSIGGSPVSQSSLRSSGRGNRRTSTANKGGSWTSRIATSRPERKGATLVSLVDGKSWAVALAVSTFPSVHNGEGGVSSPCATKQSDGESHPCFPSGGARQRKNSRKKAPPDDTQKATQKRKSRPTGEGSSSGHPVVLDCQNKLIGTVMYFDYPVLSKYGLMSLLAPLIESLDWKHFFSIRESTLIPVTFEVLATLQIKHLHNWTDKVIRFSAFGEEYSLSLDDERSLAPMQSLNYRRGRACRPAPSPPPEAPGGALDQFRKDGFARLDAMQLTLMQ
nr:hypothetical protein Itr_chr15CG11550 [Ipomoea trifida]